LGADYTRLKADERVVFYPTVAQRIPCENAWRAEIRGRVFEPERRGWLTTALREALELKNIELTPEEEKLFNERARLVLVDHERGKKVFVRFSNQIVTVGESGADGRFVGEVVLPVTALERQAQFTAVFPKNDQRVFPGEVFLLEDEGLSVISDIDDTIKITEVRDRNATLRNTFLREFQPVPGMAELYQRLAREHGAQFHYISASPWQLYEPLAAFVKTNGFPPGTFELKDFRWKSRKFFSLFANPEKYKSGVIEPRLRQFPTRRFILIGDSGERDPEIYASLARKYPQQIERIYIRDVTDEPATAERYTKAFTGIPIERWQVFREPAEIQIPATP
jgi:phosphatidate phosphatase APP1